MMKSLEQLVCQISDGEGTVRGTGFFIRPDGYVITCYHVVDNCKGDIRVGIFGESEPITSEVERKDELYDIAVLKINRENCQVLPLSTEWKPLDRVFSHGFSIQHSRGTFPKGFPMRESVLIGKTNVKNKKAESELELFVLDNTEVDYGLSGAPAVNASTGKVIGILRWKYREGEKALVTPIDLLFEMLPDLKTHHELNQYPIIKVEDQRTQEIFELRVQTVLEKENKELEGKFSRTEPTWIDFETGFIVEREEVDDIINKLENNNIQLVLGKPASGKSVILKNIGFKLAKKGHRVYIIELKKWSADRVESYFKEAKVIDDDGIIIIVDDAHLPEKLSKCEELIRDYRYKKLRTKLIIGSRDVKEIKESRTEEFSTEESEFKKFFDHRPLNEVLTEIHAIDATEKMIDLFLTKKDRVRGEHLIESVSRGLEEYKHDLWYLSWALKAYDKDTDTVNKEKVFV